MTVYDKTTAPEKVRRVIVNGDTSAVLHIQDGRVLRRTVTRPGYVADETFCPAVDLAKLPPLPRRRK